jgi:hypothetical protein
MYKLLRFFNLGSFFVVFIDSMVSESMQLLVAKTRAFLGSLAGTINS